MTMREQHGCEHEEVRANDIEQGRSFMGVCPTISLAYRSAEREAARAIR